MRIFAPWLARSALIRAVLICTPQSSISPSPHSSLYLPVLLAISPSSPRARRSHLTSSFSAASRSTRSRHSLLSRSSTPLFSHHLSRRVAAARISHLHSPASPPSNALHLSSPSLPFSSLLFSSFISYYHIFSLSSVSSYFITLILQPAENRCAWWRERWLVDGDVEPGRSDDDVAVNGDASYRFGRLSDQLAERRQVVRGGGRQAFHAWSCCFRSARSAAMARAVWLFTAPQLMPIAAATSASEKSA